MASFVSPLSMTVLSLNIRLDALPSCLFGMLECAEYDFKCEGQGMEKIQR